MQDSQRHYSIHGDEHDMSNKSITNIAASVRARLLNASRERGCTFNALLVRYANERFLYRLSVSPYKDAFILKGSNLFLIWQQGFPYRQTIDSDFLVVGQADEAYLKSIFIELCESKVEVQDGIVFDPASVAASEIREDTQYGGTRITLEGFLGVAKVHLQFDLGVGDVVTPAPILSNYPGVLDFASPVLRAYPRETAIAEKTKTMVTLGMLNSRMKDFADILVLERNFGYDFALLQKAVTRTFARYEVALPKTLPTCFSNDFAQSPAKQNQWSAFCRKSYITELPKDFAAVVSECSNFLLPLLFPPTPAPQHWLPDGTWK